MRNGEIFNTLTSLDIVGKVKCGSIILEVFEGFFSLNLEYNLYTEFVIVMFEKRDFFKAQGRDFFQNLAKKIGLLFCDDNTKKEEKI